MKSLSSKKIAPIRTCLPIKALTDFFCRPGSRFLPCPLGKQKHRYAFQVLPCTKQLVHLGKKIAPIRT